MKRYIAAVGLVAAAAVLATAGAMAAGTTQVDGVQTLVDIGDPFDPTDDIWSMAGYGDGRPGLIGAWYTRTFVVTNATPSGAVTARGTEEFVGCLDADASGACGGSDPTGTLE